MVLHPGMDDAIDVGWRKGHGVPKEAYELIKRKFRKIGAGQGALQQLQEDLFLRSSRQNGDRGHPGPKRKRRDKPLVDHSRLNLTRLSKPLIARKQSDSMFIHVESRFAVGHSGQLHPPIQTLPSVPPFFLPEIFVDGEEETVDLCVACGVFASEDGFGGADTGGVYSVAETFGGRIGTGESSV